MEKELILKAKECKSAEEIMVLAKENEVEITEEQAKEIFENLHSANGEIADNELDSVAGGIGSFSKPKDEKGDLFVQRFI